MMGLKIYKLTTWLWTWSL